MNKLESGIRIEGVKAEISSQRDAVMAMQRMRENIEYKSLLYFITVGAKEIGPFFRTWEMIVRAMMKESRYARDVEDIGG